MEIANKGGFDEAQNTNDFFYKQDAPPEQKTLLLLNSKGVSCL
jgi:hypothetical protein